jgi:hypothetical protein
MYPVMTNSGRRAWVGETRRRLGRHWSAAVREAGTAARAGDARPQPLGATGAPAPARS